MEGICVVDEAGVTVASVGFDSLRGDTALFGGFLSAIQVFVQRISGNQVKELKFGKTRLLISTAGDNYIVTLHSEDDSDAEAKNRAVTELIRNRVKHGLNDGVLTLAKEMIETEALTKEGREEMKSDIEKELDSLKSQAKEWGKRVF